VRSPTTGTATVTEADGLDQMASRKSLWWACSHLSLQHNPLLIYNDNHNKYMQRNP
jgi:hypothetical protein